MAEKKIITEADLKDIPKEIVVNKKEKLNMQELNQTRGLLERRKVQVAVVYTKTMGSAKRILTTSMEVDAQIDKNAKGWTEFLGKVGKKNGVDLIKYNYTMDYENGKFIAPTPEQQKGAEDDRKFRTEEAQDDNATKVESKV